MLDTFVWSGRVEKTKLHNGKILTSLFTLHILIAFDLFQDPWQLCCTIIYTVNESLELLSLSAFYFRFQGTSHIEHPKFMWEMVT